MEEFDESSAGWMGERPPSAIVPDMGIGLWITMGIKKETWDRK